MKITVLPQEASLLLYPQPEERTKSQLKNKSCGYKLNYLQDREEGEVVDDDAVGEPDLGTSSAQFCLLGCLQEAAIGR